MRVADVANRDAMYDVTGGQNMKLSRVFAFVALTAGQRKGQP